MTVGVQMFRSVGERTRYNKETKSKKSESIHTETNQHRPPKVTNLTILFNFLLYPNSNLAIPMNSPQQTVVFHKQGKGD